MLWLLLLSFKLVSPFKGKEHWEAHLNKCQRTDNGDWSSNPSLRCYIVHDKLHFFKVEVLSLKPILLRYHNLVHRRLCKRLLEENKLQNLQMASIISQDPTKNAVYSTMRMANSTWIEHRELTNFNHLFNTLQRTLLALDLSKAERFQILSYHKDGHYSPHYDYLDQHTGSTVEVKGNRITTVFTVLQQSKKGGGTVFPHLNLNIRPNAGDTLVWMNMETDGRLDGKSWHAACPVQDGVKIGATLWVRSFGQELRLPCGRDKSWKLESFLRVKSKYEDRPLFCKGPGPG